MLILMLIYVSELCPCAVIATYYIYFIVYTIQSLILIKIYVLFHWLNFFYSFIHVI